VVVEDSDVSGVDFSGIAGGIPSGNNAPLAVPDKYYTDGELEVENVSGVLANDFDPDGDDLTAVIVSEPLYGTLKLEPAGGFSYIPDNGNVRNDTFTYSANDGSLSSQPVTVEIVIENNEEIPVTAVSDIYELVSDSVLNISSESGVLVNDLNADNKTVSVAEEPEHGKIELNDDGGFRYTPDSGYDGRDSFTYKINDTDPEKTAEVTLIVLPEKVTAGSVLTISDSMVKGLNGSSFAKAPKIYGMLANGKKASFKKVKTSTPAEFSGVWSKKVSLYDKKALKASGYKSYFDSNGALKPMSVTVMVKGKTADKAKIDEKVMRVQLVPPVITEILDSAGNNAVEFSAGSTITVKGKYFGTKVPKAALEINGKLVKCKIDTSSFIFSDKIKNKPSPMDSETGESQIKLTIPGNIQKGAYPLILDNKIGIATTPYIDDNDNGALPLIIIK
jgi:VCBS repeat-containing protein